jgi:hypothetical protein
MFCFADRLLTFTFAQAQIMAALHATRCRDKEEDAAVDLSGVDFEASVDFGDFLVQVEEC